MEEKESAKINPIGIYGWRKQFMYCLVLVLMGIIFLNACITAWILIVLKFNMNGLGGVVFTEEGLQVEDTALFMDTVYLQSIEATDQLQIESHGNITLETSDGSSKMEMNADSITMQTTQFIININSPANGDTTTSHTLLSATEEGGVQLGSGSLQLNGSFVDENITTKEILGLSDDGLVIEGSRIDMVGDESIQLIAENGPIDLIATGNMTLSSTSGQISLSASAIVLEGLVVGIPLAPGSSSQEVVYNLCSCPSGQLYRVLASLDNTNGCMTANDHCNNN